VGNDLKERVAMGPDK